jgi:Protein of unknown function (DUF664)
MMVSNQGHPTPVLHPERVVPMLPPVADERENLLGYLAEQRQGIRTTAYGLTDEQARMAPTVSTLCIGGLIKHVTSIERSWMDTILQRSRNDVAAYRDDFVFGPNETLQGILDDHERAGAETDAIIAAIDDLGQAVPVPKGVPWFPQDVEAWSVRWVLGHVIEEVARHAGHADIIRESIDGATMYELVAAVEGWPETEWIKPWKPAPRAQSTMTTHPSQGSGRTLKASRYFRVRPLLA